MPLLKGRVADDDTATEVPTYGGWTLGRAADAAGGMYACDPTMQYLWPSDPVDWQPEDIARWYVTRFRVPASPGFYCIPESPA